MWLFIREASETIASSFLRNWEVWSRALKLSLNQSPMVFKYFCKDKDIEAEATKHTGGFLLLSAHLINKKASHIVRKISVDWYWKIHITISFIVSSDSLLKADGFVCFEIWLIQSTACLYFRIVGPTRCEVRHTCLLPSKTRVLITF